MMVLPENLDQRKGINDIGNEVNTMNCSRWDSLEFILKLITHTRMSILVNSEESPINQKAQHLLNFRYRPLSIELGRAIRYGGQDSGNNCCLQTVED